MTCNILQLNSDKTGVIIFGPDHLAKKLQLFIGRLATSIKSTLRNVGITFDSQVFFEPHVNNLIKSCYEILSILNQLCLLLTSKSLFMPSHALTTVRHCLHASVNFQ